MREGAIDAGGVRLRYAEGEDAGPPLVLLHGGVLGWEEFVPLLPALSMRWRVLAPVLSGHGGSARRERYTHGAWVEEASVFIESRANGPAVVVGHSLGGHVGMGVAARRPDLVRALVLFDSFIYLETLFASPIPELFTGLARLGPASLGLDDLARRMGEVLLHVPGLAGPVPWGAMPGVDEPVRRYLAGCLHRADPALLPAFATASAFEDYDPDALLRAIACPVLLIQGDPALGGMLTDGDLARARPHLAGATRARLDGVGHFLHLQDPAPVLRALLWFLESLREPGEAGS